MSEDVVGRAARVLSVPQRAMTWDEAGAFERADVMSMAHALDEAGLLKNHSMSDLYQMAGEARATAEHLADRLQAARDFIVAREREDDWGIACVSTEELRNILEMPPR